MRDNSKTRIAGSATQQAARDLRACACDDYRGKKERLNTSFVFPGCENDSTMLASVLRVF